MLVDRERDAVDEQVRQDGHDGERHDQRGEQRECHGQGEREEQLADEPADEAEREEHADGCQGGGRDSRRHLAGAVEDGCEPVLPQGPVAVDVLEDHDRVIDDAADRDREAAQRHDVEADAGELHDDERGQHRQRDRYRGDERRAEAPEEQEDRQDREQRAKAALADQAVLRLFDE